MRFMMLVIPKGYESAEPNQMPDPEHVKEMMKYNEALQKAGVLLALDGLHPPSAGFRVTYKDRKPTVTDGPFAEVKECVGGYWMLQLKSRDEAIEWARRAPMNDGETIEVRQVHEFEEYTPEVQQAAEGFKEMHEAAQQKK